MGEVMACHESTKLQAPTSLTSASSLELKGPWLHRMKILGAVLLSPSESVDIWMDSDRIFSESERGPSLSYEQRDKTMVNN